MAELSDRQSVAVCFLFFLLLTVALSAVLGNFDWFWPYMFIPLVIVTAFFGLGLGFAAKEIREEGKERYRRDMDKRVYKAVPTQEFDDEVIRDQVRRELDREDLR